MAGSEKSGQMKGIRQLAEHLDISIGTVSRALNGKPDVNEETRRRVLETAQALGYVANQSGRSLRQGTTNVIGLMIESSKETVDNSDNFFLGLTGGLQSVFARHKLDLAMLPCPSDEDPHEYLQRMVARRLVDAMILSATQRVDRRIDLLVEARIPFVALGRSSSGGSHSVDRSRFRRGCQYRRRPAGVLWPPAHRDCGPLVRHQSRLHFRRQLSPGAGAPRSFASTPISSSALNPANRAATRPVMNCCGSRSDRQRLS